MPALMWIDTSNLGSIVLAALTLANTVLLVWTNRKVERVHTQVNGMTAAAVKASELAGFSRGAGTAPPPNPSPPGPESG